MSKSRSSRIIALLVAGACIFAAYRVVGHWFSDDDRQATSTNQLVNHVWIDHMPTDARDTIFHLVLLDQRERVGATGASSQWRHFVEIFLWRLRGDVLNAYFPQDQQRARARVETWNCAGSAPEPFELCLQITDDNGGHTMLYSREDWVIEGDTLDDDLSRLVESEPRLRGVADELRGQQASDFDPDSAADWPVRSGRVIPLGAN